MSFEERLAGLFEPHTVLPAQYFNSLRRRTEFNGERKLMLAILEDAVDCYRKHAAARDNKARHLFAEAESWIEAPDSNWLFSFQNICDVLGLESEYIRGGLRKIKAAANQVANRRMVQLRAEHPTPLELHQANAG
jgi:hypothetical protein